MVDNLIENNDVSSNGSCTDDALYLGIFVESEAENQTILDNVLADNLAQGISGFGPVGTVVRNNQIDENGAGGGNFIYSGVYFEDVEDTTIEDNTLFENYWNGIFVNGYTSPLDISGNTVTLRIPSMMRS